MKQPPVIIVQFVHLQGPFKGQIQELSQNEITVGRHPSCTVKFPSDLKVVSRQHAAIVRDGNRYKVVDHSTNGTFVNGKRVQESYLKNGDVIDFAEGGPKVSFLMQIQEVEISAEKTPTPPPPPPLQEDILSRRPAAPPTPGPEMQREPELVVENVQAPLVIQYGPTIRSYKNLPITIGKHPSCDFILDHPDIFDHHAQIFFTRNQYWVKDLTGRRLIRLNRQPIGTQAPLNADDDLSLGPKGPSFRFLGAGRLAETEESPYAEPLSPGGESKASHYEEPDRQPPKSGGFAKRFLRD